MARGHFNQFADANREIDRNMRAETEQAAVNNRRHGRIRPDAIWCSLGVVLDLSASGLRVLSRRALAGVHTVTLRDGNVSVAVRARIVRCRKVGFWKHEVGVEFLAISPEDSARLRAMAVV